MLLEQLDARLAEAGCSVDELLMKEPEVDSFVQRALKKHPGQKPRIISDNGPQFMPCLPFGIGTNAKNLCGRMPQLPSA